MVSSEHKSGQVLSSELARTLIPLISPNGRIFDNLFGDSRAKVRVSVMRQITDNAKFPKSRAGANAVFSALCMAAGIDDGISHAGRETELVNWIKRSYHQCQMQ